MSYLFIYSAIKALMLHFRPRDLREVVMAFLYGEPADREIARYVSRFLLQVLIARNRPRPVAGRGAGRTPITGLIAQ